MLNLDVVENREILLRSTGALVSDKHVANDFDESASASSPLSFATALHTGINLVGSCKGFNLAVRISALGAGECPLSALIEQLYGGSVCGPSKRPEWELNSTWW